MSGASTPNASLSRTLVLASPNPPDTEILRWPPKSPGTVQDYSLDVTAWAADAGETVASFTTMVSAPGSTTAPLLAAAQPLATGSNVCTVQLSGGASPTDCAVTFVIQSATRTLTLTVWIVVTSISGTLDRYGGLAFLQTAVDPATTQAIAGLQSQITNEVTARVAGDAANAAANEALAETVASIESTLNSSGGSYTSLANQLADFEGSTGQTFTSLTGSLSDLSDGISSLQASTGQSFTSIGQTLSGLSSEIAGFETGINQSLTSTNQTLSGLASQLNAFEAQVNAFETQVQAEFAALPTGGGGGSGGGGSGGGGTGGGTPLTPTGVTPGTYSDGFMTITVNLFGQVTAISSTGTIPVAPLDYLLEEDGFSDVLLEDASGFVLLANTTSTGTVTSPSPSYLLEEDGTTDFAFEDGSGDILLEASA